MPERSPSVAPGRAFRGFEVHAPRPDEQLLSEARQILEAAPETAKSVLDGTMTLGAAFDEAIVTGSAERGPF